MTPDGDPGHPLHELRFAWAWRPVSSEWIVFNRTDLIREQREDLTLSSESLRWVGNLHAHWQAAPGRQLGLQLGLRHVISEFDGERYRGLATLIGADLRQAPAAARVRPGPSMSACMRRASSPARRACRRHGRRARYRSHAGAQCLAVRGLQLHGLRRPGFRQFAPDGTRRLSRGADQGRSGYFPRFAARQPAPVTLAWLACRAAAPRGPAPQRCNSSTTSSAPTGRSPDSCRISARAARSCAWPRAWPMRSPRAAR